MDTKSVKKISQEPKRQNRYEVVFPDSLPIESYFIESINAPSCKLNHMNELYMWSDIEIKLLDIIGPSVSKRLFDFKDYFKTNKEFVFKLNLFDPTGIITETWTITADNIKDINFGSFHFDSTEINYLTLKLSISNCILKLS